MGGLSSGRYRTRNRGSVENVLRIDIRQLRRWGYLRPGTRVTGTWRWNRGGEPSGSAGFTVSLTEPEGGWLDLSFTVNGEPRSPRILIESMPCRLGGRRYYFRCPKTGRRCEVLCCVAGEFAARQAHRLTYASQSEERLDRLARARDKAERRWRPTDGRGRPRGANRERLIERWIELEAAWEAEFAEVAMRRFGMLF